MDINEAIKSRRSIYDISPSSKISDDCIKDIIESAIMHSPSAFNSQSSKAVLLLGEHHKKLWSITKDILKKAASADQWPATDEKISKMANGHGSILFFDDESITKGLQERFPLYSEKFPLWAEQSNGILQYMIWTSLQAKGLGASIQHYNPLIDESVKKLWGISDKWRLIGQMPFGEFSAIPEPKSKMDINERMKVFL